MSILWKEIKTGIKIILAGLYGVVLGLFEFIIVEMFGFFVLFVVLVIIASSVGI
jgi:hypothetical protein